MLQRNEVDILEKKLPQISDERLRSALAENGTVRKYQAGEAIMSPGKFIRFVPLILEGSIKVIRADDEGRELFLYYLQPGETCALSLTCYSSAKPSEVKAIAEEDTTVLAIPIELHNEWMTEYRQWKKFIALTYQSRFQELLKTLDAVAFKRLDQRLVEYLIAKMTLQKINQIQITHQEIATELGTSREVVSRLLKQLEKKKWIELGRNIIYIREDLAELAAEHHD